MLKPALQEYIWGGTKLKYSYGKAAALDAVAESWELSVHPAGRSLIASGELSGSSFADYYRDQRERFGTFCSGLGQFPILVKLIDAAKPLSIQVHPDDAYARLHMGEAGKTELWIILEHEEGAFIYAGFQREVSRAELLRRIQKNTLEEVLRRIPVSRGDIFFLRPGTIHAISAGILLAEVQQSSNSTFRVYDYGRTGADGNPRTLHIDRAMDVLQLTPSDLVAPGAALLYAGSAYTMELLADCEHFTVRRLNLKTVYEEPTNSATFVAVLCVRGAGGLRAWDTILPLTKGDTCFVPANTPCRLTGPGEFLLIGYRGGAQAITKKEFES